MKGIHQFIDLITEKLPEYEYIRTDTTCMSGRELKLTGVKNFHGQPIDDHETYSIDLPVMKGMMVEQDVEGMKIETHIPKPIDHRQRMRKEWLAHGLQGIYKYLEQYLDAGQMSMVKNTFMKVQHGEAVLNK